jgi:hypothetical protein
MAALPKPVEHALPEEAVIAVPLPPRGLTLYRLLESEEPGIDDFEPTWTRPQAQLRGVPELFRSGLSHWLDQARAAAQSGRRQVWVARLELEPHPLTRVALTEQFGEGHVDVWGYPRDLLRAVVGVVRVPKRA